MRLPKDWFFPGKSLCHCCPPTLHFQAVLAGLSPQLQVEWRLVEREPGLGGDSLFGFGRHKGLVRRGGPN